MTKAVVFAGRDFRWMLHTVDAHPLCEQFGFTAPDTTFMQRDFRFPAPKLQS